MNKTTNATERLAVGISEAAALLSVSRRTVENYVRVKAIRARKVGRRTLIPVSALEDFLRRDHDSASPKRRRDEGPSGLEEGASDDGR